MAIAIATIWRLIDLLNRCIKALDKVHSENKSTVNPYFCENVDFQNVMFSVTEYFIINNLIIVYVSFGTMKMRF